jgi:hypothetical protein
MGEFYENCVMEDLSRVDSVTSFSWVAFNLSDNECTSFCVSVIIFISAIDIMCIYISGTIMPSSRVRLMEEGRPRRDVFVTVFTCKSNRYLDDAGKEDK